MSSKLKKLAAAIKGTPGVAQIREDKLAAAERQESGPPQSRGSFSQPFVPQSDADVGYVLYAPGMKVEVGMHLEIPLDYLIENPENPRTNYNEADIDEMVSSLKRDAQLQSIQVYPPTSLGAPMMIREGHSRWKAAKILNYPTLRADVVPRPADALEEYRKAREVNKRRNNLTIFDDAIRFKEIFERDPGLKVSELEAYLGEKPPYVSKARTIADLPQEILNRMLENKDVFGISQAYNVALYFKKKGSAETGVLIDRICSGEVSAKQVQNMINAAAPKPNEEGQRRARPLRRAEIKGGGKGELKLFPMGRIELRVMLGDKKVENTIFDRLREVFAEHGLTFADDADA